MVPPPASPCLDRRTASARLSSVRAPRGHLRRRLHALAARARARARGVPPCRARTRARSRPGPLRGGAPRRDGGSPLPPGARPRRGALGRRSPRTSSGAWAAMRRAPGRARPTWCDAGRSTRTSTSTTTRSPCSQSLREHRLCDRADLERPARPRGVRRAITCSTSTSPSARRRTGATKPHASIFERALAALDVSVTEAVMVGRLVRRRHRGRAGARDARDPARPRRAAIPGEPDRITDLFQLPVALGL